MSQQSEQEEGHISSSFKKHPTSPQETPVPTSQPAWAGGSGAPKLTFPSRGEIGSDNSLVTVIEQAL